jgi:hypothetical protein
MWAVRFRRALALFYIPATALAQDTAAKADLLFRSAVALMKEGNFASACPRIEESQQLDPRPGVLFTLADCLANAGRIGSALLRYEDFLRSVAQLPASQQARQRDRIKAAEEQHRRLLPLVPTLTLVLDAGSPEPTTMQLDGQDLSRTRLGIPLPMDPGEHSLKLITATGATQETKTSLRQGQHTRLLLSFDQAIPSSVETPRPSAPPKVVFVPYARDPSPSPFRVAAYSAGTAALGALLLGTVAGFATLHYKGIVAEQCTHRRCSVDGKAAVDQGRTWGTISTLGFALGATALLTATTLWFAEPAHRPAPKNLTSKGTLIPTVHLSASGGFAGIRTTW